MPKLYTRENEPRDRHWAIEKDPERLSEFCANRIEDYQEQLRTSNHWNEALRNWRYFHNMFFDRVWDLDSMAVTQLGREGEQVGYAENHFRNLCSHLHNLTTQHRPSFQARAKQSTQNSLKQAELGTQLTQHYMVEGGLDDVVDLAVLHALIVLGGFVFMRWNPEGGQEVAAFEEENGRMEIVRQGDWEAHNLTSFDVVHDLAARNWRRDVHWLCCRTFESKWAVAEQVERRYRDRVLDLQWEEESDSFYRGTFRLDSEYSDLIPVWHFFHADGEDIPGGRYMAFVRDDIPIGEPEELPYKRIPVFRCVAGETLLTVFGYSPANDLCAPQEILNAEVSTIATNHNAFGTQHVWAPEGSEYTEDFLNEHLALIKGGERPAQGINLTATPPEIFKFVDMVRSAMETISGINSVARGQPEANLKSGEALKVMDSKAVQFAAPLIKSYHSLIEDVGTFILRETPRQMEDGEERILTIVGEDQRPYHKAFKAEDLVDIDRVVVESGNYMAQTMSGKLAIADSLREQGWLKTPEEYLTVLRTGQLRPLLKADQAELDLIHDENERLRDGRPVRASGIDNHVLHIREHHSEINSVEVREDEQRMQVTLAHLMEHITLLNDVSVQQLQVALGYPVPFPATTGTPPGMAPPGAGGGNGAAAGIMPGEQMPPGPPPPGEPMPQFERFEQFGRQQ